MRDDDFYRRCADLLGVDYECAGFPYAIRNRWNNRAPGSGRFPGMGVIRVFGDEVCLSLRRPVRTTRTIVGRDAALEWLAYVMDASR